MDEFLEKIKSELVNSFMQIPNTMAKIFDKNLLSNFKTEEGKIGDQNAKIVHLLSFFINFKKGLLSILFLCTMLYIGTM